MAERIQAAGNRVVQAGKTHSMELILFPIIFLFFSGVIANSFTSSAINTSPQLPATTCSSNAQALSGAQICFPTNTNGCDNSVSNCNFTSATSYSFLNPNSPFAQLLTGNVLGFLASAFSGSETPNSYQIGETLCVGFANGAYLNQTGQGITKFSCAGDIRYGNAQLPNVLPLLNATSNNGNVSIWSLNGCPNTVGVTCTNGTSSNGQYSQAETNAFYIINGTTLTTGQCTVLGVTYPQCGVFWRVFAAGGVTTFTCASSNGTLNYYGKLINLKVSTYYCLIPYSTQAGSTSASTGLASTFSVWGFIFGFILLVLGLGITLSTQIVGSGGTVGANQQGSKMAQAFGLGILVWTFIFGEFGATWLPNLPFNFGTMITVTFTAMFFLGLYWRIFSYE